MIRRRAALVASAIVIATGLVYVGMLVRQAGPDGVLAGLHPNTVIFSISLLFLAILTGYGALGGAPERRALALWAALPGLVVLGVLAGFSIGWLLLVAAIPTLIAGLAALREDVVRRAALLAAAIATLAWVGVGAALLWLPSVV